MFHWEPMDVRRSCISCRILRYFISMTAHTCSKKPAVFNKIRMKKDEGYVLWHQRNHAGGGSELYPIWR